MFFITKDTWPVALSGFIGASSPSLVELVSMCKTNSLPHFSFYIGTFIMGILGTAIVLIAKETIPWKAFTQGIAAPSLFSSAATAATTVVAMNICSAVYAQEPIVLKDTTQHDVVLIVSRNLTNQQLPSIQISKTKVGKTLVFFDINDSSMVTTFTVPDKDTVKVRLKVEDPAIRRAIVQSIMPMQRGITDEFRKKLTIEEIK